jgi:hypothetical protein
VPYELVHRQLLPAVALLPVHRRRRLVLISLMLLPLLLLCTLPIPHHAPLHEAHEAHDVDLIIVNRVLKWDPQVDQWVPDYTQVIFVDMDANSDYISRGYAAVNSVTLVRDPAGWRFSFYRWSRRVAIRSRTRMDITSGYDMEAKMRRGEPIYRGRAQSAYDDAASTRVNQL